jgi:2-aminoethylphosphonate dioxygenase
MKSARLATFLFRLRNHGTKSKESAQPYASWRVDKDKASESKWFCEWRVKRIKSLTRPQHPHIPYLTMPHTLSPEQIASFHAEGYLILQASEHDLVDPADLQSWTAEVKGWPKEKGKWMTYEEINSHGQSQLLRTEKFIDYHDNFYNFLCGDDMASLLKQLSGDDMLLFKEKLNYKLANGNGFAAHLDAPAYDHVSAGRRVEHVTANLAVDDATLENGCLEVVPRSHLETVPFVSGGHITPEWEAAHEWLPVPLAPGDMLIFGSHLAHRSGPNKSPRARTMCYATYAGKKEGRDLRERYYEDRRANFPPEHEREIGKDYGEGWKRYAFAAPFSNVGIGKV